jgi:hypothetical protein
VAVFQYDGDPAWSLAQLSQMQRQADPPFATALGGSPAACLHHCPALRSVPRAFLPSEISELLPTCLRAPPAASESSSLGHDHSKNVVDPRGITGAVLSKPFEYIRVQTDGHQFLGRTPELGKLFIGEFRNIGIVDLSNASALLPPSNAFQRLLLVFSKRLAPDRPGTHADLLPGPR